MTNDVMGILKEGISIEISKDKMLGVISFTPPSEGEERLTEDEIRSAIAAASITTGIIEDDLKELCQKHQYNYKYIIAKGKLPQDGQDGYIKFNFDVEGLKQLKPKINEDGTVDLKDLSAVKNVKKGDVLARKVPATEGEDGYNILGQTLRGKRGKEARIPKGRNTVILEDNLTLVSEIDGKLEYDDHNVYINSVYNVMGDVDSSIGNIDFVGDVVIYGGIHTGFTVRAGGSIEVKGSVDDAIIEAGKDIILSYGIQGTEKSRLVAGGDIIAKFIQNAHAEAGGNVITEAILHSTVTAGNSVKVEMGKGTIVGGNVSATNLIVAKSIGSPMGTVTALQIGMPPSIYIEYKRLGEELKHKAESLNKVDQSIKFLLSKGTQLDTQKKIMLQKFNLTRQPLCEEYEEVKAKYKVLGNRLNNVQEGIIKFADTVYPGVKVTFGNLVKYIDERYAHSLIRKSEGEIIIE